MKNLHVIIIVSVVLSGLFTASGCCRTDAPVSNGPPPSLAVSPPRSDAAIPPLRLILQITVDSLRGDSLRRHEKLFGAGGFRYFMDNGLRFDNAHHPQAHTVTVVGHANLATGAAPSEHGMVGNEWYDAASDKVVANIRDSACVPIPNTESGIGASTRAIRTDTFADALAIHTASSSKRFAVSVKDRGAVPMAGHSGKAFWYSTRSGQFISSSCYYDKLPKWANNFNDRRLRDKWKGKNWNLAREPGSYLFGDSDDQPWEADIDGFGRTFPHRFPDTIGGAYYNLLTLSPMGDDLTADFARAIIKGESLGADDVPDYLSISFSSTDYIGHYFGPSSLEYEDNLVHLDAVLASLLKYVDDTVGLAHTLLVFSSDHGTPDAPDWLKARNIPAGRLNPDRIDLSPLNMELQTRFGLGLDLIRRTGLPWVYLDHGLIARRQLNTDEVAKTIARFFESIDGIARAVPIRELMARSVLTPLETQILRNWYPGRAGDIHLVSDIHWHMEGGSDSLVALHGSPWVYDTWVPLIFAGHDIAAGRVLRRVETIDVAPTLSAIVGCSAPAGSTGTPLSEAVVRTPAMQP